MHTVPSTRCVVRKRDAPILDHGINVDEIAQPHRLAERGW
jgi:hypothetical protein